MLILNLLVRDFIFIKKIKLKLKNFLLVFANKTNKSQATAKFYAEEVKNLVSEQ